jgi:dUTP pyrophosphatase
MKVYAKEEKLLHKKIHDNDAGVDLSTSQDITVRAFEVTKIPTGVSVELKDAWGLVTGRSSLNVRGLIVANGIIDEGYRGEIYVTIYNTTAQDVEFKKGERIAQIIPIPYVKEISYEIGEAKKNTKRADKGFGSSGR